MSTSSPFSDFESMADWQATLDFANDQERYPVDPRHACGNPDCAHLTEAIFHSEGCRIAVEGDAPDDDDQYDADGEGCLLEPQAPAPPAPLPEAPCSVNVHMQIHGRDVLVTLRGIEEVAVLARLEALLARYPVAQASSVTPSSPSNGANPTCPMHQAPMKLNHGKDGSTWYSHKTADGWCKGKG